MSVAFEPQAATGRSDQAAPPRRRRRWGERVTLGHAGPLVLAVLAAVFVLTAVRDRSATVEVPVASSPIPAGTAVNAGDTRLVKIHRADGGLRSGLLAAGDLGGGWVAAVRIDAGDPITRSVVTHAAAGSGLGAMSIPVPVERADGGGIGPGDRVDVLAGDGNGGASYVAQGLMVVAVSPTRTSGVLAGASSDFWVTVAVDRATALRLTAALGASGAAPGTSLEVVRSTGETAPAPQTSYAPTAAAGRSGSAGR